MKGDVDLCSLPWQYALVHKKEASLEGARACAPLTAENNPACLSTPCSQHCLLT